MSKLCDSCPHRRDPDKNLLDRSSIPGASASVQRELNRQRFEFEARLRIEDQVYKTKGIGGVILGDRPVKYAWCAAPARSQPDSGAFYFCDWLTDDFYCEDNPLVASGHGP